MKYIIILCFLPLTVWGAKSSDKESSGGQPVVPYNFEEEVTGASQLLPQVGISEADWAQGRPWQPPDYSRQDKALGWNETAFEIPQGLERRVEFWRNVYAKYSTDQGVLHDKVFPDVIYEVFDFGDIMKDPNKNLWQKNKEREARVESAKKRYLSMLKKFGKMKAKTAEMPQGLSSDERRIWKLVSDASKNPNRFKVLNDKKRIRFQLGQKSRFLAAIFRSGRYIRDMEKIFREAGLPLELTRLPFVESSFQLRAKSKVGASGIWQFMPETGKAYMTVGAYVDERYDPLKSTVGAAKLFKLFFKEMGSWPLAITSYNHGAKSLKKVVKQLKTDDISEVIAKFSSDRFGFASENFFACFLAALDVERHATQYFGEARWENSIPLQEVKTSVEVDWSELVEFFDGDIALAQQANPHLTDRVISMKVKVPVGADLNMPRARVTLAEEWAKGLISSNKLSSALRDVSLNWTKPKDMVFPNMSASAPESTRAHEILSPGQALEIQKQTVELLATDILPGGGERTLITYKVQAGDTIVGLARRFGITPDRIRQHNRLSKDDLKVGQNLAIPSTN